MTLPDLTALKNYLRAGDTSAEDDALTAILASATAMVQRFVERPLTLAVRTFVVDAYTLEAYGVVRRLSLGIWPVHPGRIADPAADPPVTAIAAPVLTDADLNVVDVALYRVDPWTGLFIANRGECFPDGPYTITASVGLAAFPNYDDEIAPVLWQAILDVASDLYSNRTPSAASEMAGGGAGVTWRPADECGIPPRACAMLRAYKPVGVA